MRWHATGTRLLGDRYRLARRIAVGGMGEVWRAEDAVLHRTVAVKVLKSEFTSDPTFLERFRTEARTTASLSHPGIANVFDYGEVAGPENGSADIPLAYLVMEYVDGEPLSAQLARDGRLPAARVLDVVRQAALALSEAHRVGMVHRDVKPGNLLVRRSDGAVKITDFGIARAADAVPLTQNGMVVGTAQYFSPEQAEGRVVGPASDVYSLGVVAYECLAGRLPFIADSPVAVAMMQIRDAPPPLPADVPAAVRLAGAAGAGQGPAAALRDRRRAGGGGPGGAGRTVRARAGSGSRARARPGPAWSWRRRPGQGAAPPPAPDGIGGTNPSLAVPAAVGGRPRRFRVVAGAGCPLRGAAGPAAPGSPIRPTAAPGGHVRARRHRRPVSRAPRRRSPPRRRPGAAAAPAGRCGSPPCCCSRSPWPAWSPCCSTAVPTAPAAPPARPARPPSRHLTRTIDGSTIDGRLRVR